MTAPAERGGNLPAGRSRHVQRYDVPSEVTQTDQVGSGCVPYRLCWEPALFDACLAVGRACRVSKLGKGKPSGVRGSRDEPL